MCYTFFIITSDFSDFGQGRGAVGVRGAAHGAPPVGLAGKVAARGAAAGEPTGGGHCWASPGRARVGGTQRARWAGRAEGRVGV